MADCNVANNPEFSMLFCSSSHIFVLKISVDVPFSTHLTFNEKISFVRSGEKVFKSLNNSIARRCKLLWCTETIISLFLKVLLS